MRKGKRGSVFCFHVGYFDFRSWWFHEVIICPAGSSLRLEPKHSEAISTIAPAEEYLFCQLKNLRASPLVFYGSLTIQIKFTKL
jgi:hypothetical protein